MSIEVFISYAPEDQKFLDKLVKHLSNLRNQKIITDWHNGKIIAGTEWEPQILTHLHTAQIILLLISSDFLAFQFCYSTEMSHAITRHDAGEARVIPVILRPTEWEGTPFAKLQPLPTGGKPVSRWFSRDEAFNNVARGIRRAIEEWQARTPPNPLSIQQTELPRVDDILAGQIADSTRRMYSRDIRDYVKYASSLQLDPASHKTLDQWRNYLMYTYTKKDGSKLSPNSINRMLSAVRRLYLEAGRHEMVGEADATRIQKVPGVKQKDLKNRLKAHSRTRISPEDMRRLCESPNVKTLVGLRDRALLATLASSGIRASELASLTTMQIKKGRWPSVVSTR